MKSKKIILLVTAIVITVCAAFSVVGLLMWNGLGPTPPQPTIRYGEFPFRLEYEINGRVVVVEDTIICKFKGVRWGGLSLGGKHLRWETYLASGQKSPSSSSEVSLLIDNVHEIYVFVGHASWYLGYMSKYYPSYEGPNFHAFSATENYSSGDRWLQSDELLGKYNIRIISFEPSPPTENTFK